MIFVTGATGFLGSYLLYELVKLNRPVKALIRNPDKIAFVKKIFNYYEKDSSDLADSVNWVKGDILDYYTLIENMQDASLVFHSAGMVSFKDSDRSKIMRINVEGTANIVNACLELGIEKLCHVSSVSSLGEAINGELVNENMLWNPKPAATTYAVSKFKAEMEVWRGIYEGLNAVIVNPSIILGPGMWFGTSSGLFKEAYRGLSYYPTGSGGYVDVRDVVSAMIKLADSKINGERYILNAENISHQDVINFLALAMNRKLPVHKITPFIMKAVYVADKIRALLTGQSPMISLRSMEISANNTAYSNQKIKEALSLDFIPVKESVEYITKIYLDEIHQV
jgi:dihydroflavonol-4-reductase